MKLFQNKHCRSLLSTILLAIAIPAARSADNMIYPATQQAKADLAAGMKAAAASHKNILLDFGGDWCEDCHVLDIYLHDATNKPILDANYVLVHINIGRQDENLDISTRYKLKVENGVPALVVLDPHGKVLYSQVNHEFSAMRRMESKSVTAFLIHWKPTKPGCSAVQINC